MLQIKIWDVNHGSAAHIQTPNGRNVVVDLGDTDDLSPLRQLRAAGVTNVDVVVITHPHRDHMDDIGNFGLVFPAVLWTPRHISEVEIRKGNRSIDSAIVDQYLAIRQRYTSSVPSYVDLTVPANYGGAEFKVFGTTLCPTSNLNNHSLVVVASYAGLKMVIPGDNEDQSWQELLKDPAFVSAIRGTDVLLAPHHGRDSGFCADLFNAMGKPRLVVISDGRFGDTSATDRYGQQVVGWDVYNGSGHVENRNCVTTRCDGHITIKFGWNNVGTVQQRAFLEVRTSKPDSWSMLAGSLGGYGTLPR